ncbi:MAG: pitrilysin family protein [Planctomycetaceae bacterium]
MDKNPPQQFTLACGATLLVEPMPDVESASMCLLVPAGSLYEAPGQNGTAAILADLITRGAGSRSSFDVMSDLDYYGVQGSEHAGWNFLSFSAASIADNLLPALDIYADILLSPHLPATEFAAAQIGVEQSLLALEDDPSRKVFHELRRRTFDDPWGRNPEGTIEELPAITVDSVRALYQRGFRPAETIIGVAGNVDPQQIRQRFDELLANWKGGDAPVITRIPTDQSPVQIHHDATQTHIGMAWNSVSYNHPDYYVAWAAANILGGGSSSRLFTEVRERRGLCYSVSASLSSLKDEGRVFFYAGTTTERAQETLDVAWGEILRLAEGVTEEELARCRAQAKSSLIMQQESTGSRASSLARDWFHFGRIQTLDDVRRRVDAVTVDDIARYASAFPPSPTAIVTVGASPLELPSVS